MPVFGSTFVRFGLDPKIPKSNLLHQLLMVVKVDPHVLNCLAMPMQDGGLRDKFNPETRWRGGNWINLNLNLGICFLLGFKASELRRILSSRTLLRISEICLRERKNGKNCETKSMDAHLAMVAMLAESVMNMRWIGRPWEVAKRLRRNLCCAQS